MSEIERCPHDRENPYTMISTALIRDENLHPTTRWILISLLSNKPGWKINAKQFVNSLKPHGLGRDKVLSFFKQACEVGYMKKEVYFVGGLKRTRYILSEEPKFKKSLPQSTETDLGQKSGPPGSSQPTPVDQAHKYYHRSSKEELKKEDCAPAEPAPKASNFFIHERVKILIHHYEKLLNDFGKPKIDEMVERLDEYADINPKRFKEYANHATVIRKWIREDKGKSPNDKKRIFDLINKFKENHVKYFRNNTCEILKESFSFKSGAFYLEIPYDDPNFEVKFRAQVAKMGLKL